MVLQGHRLRAAAAGRHGAAGRHLAGPGDRDAAQLDRPLRGRARPLRHRGPRRAGDGVHDAPGHAVRGHVLRGRGRRAAGPRPGDRGAAAGPGGVPGRGPQGHRHRAAGHRPAEDRCLPGRARDQPGDRLGDPGLRVRLRAGRLRHRRDHGRAGPGPARLGVRPDLRPVDRAAPCGRPRTSTGEAFTGERSGDQLQQRRDLAGRAGRRRGQAPDHGLAGRRGAWGRPRSTSGCATGCCRGSATGVPRSRSSTATDCGEVAVPDDQLPVRCPTCAAPT